MSLTSSISIAIGKFATGGRAACAGLVAAAVLASTLTSVAAPLPQADKAPSALVQVNDHHHKKSQNNWNRPPQSQYQRRKKSNNEAVAIGVGIAAVLGALALSQQANSSEGMRNECRRLRWKCREGRGWACRKYDDACR